SKTPSYTKSVSWQHHPRVLDGKIFTEDRVNWDQLTSGLPQTAPVSENANAVVIQYQNKPYVRLNGGDWVPYPQ
ncbi:cellulose biosynthesis protein BcsG, partial [Enterobacter cloacae]